MGSMAQLPLHHGPTSRLDGVGGTGQFRGKLAGLTTGRGNNPGGNLAGVDVYVNILLMEEIQRKPTLNV